MRENLYKTTGEVKSIWKSTDGHFYATVHSHPNVQSDHRLTMLDAQHMRLGSSIPIITFWEDDEYQVELDSEQED